MAARVRTVFIGWGAINARVGALLAQCGAAVDIVGVATRSATPGNALPPGARHLTAPEELAALKPELVVEAAGRASVGQWAPAALAAAQEVIIASTSAFTDDDLLARLVAIAERHQSRIRVPSGAIGGIDALAGAATLALEDVLHQVVKPPGAWKNTPAEKLIDLDGLDARAVFFSGSAREAAAEYPQNANATVVTSLAGVGLDKTRVEMVADPASRTNGHRIVAQGAFGRMEIVLENNPLATNPKSSELTALSLVRLIEQRTRSISI